MEEILPKEAMENASKLTETHMTKLKQIARGYISYVKGDNPISFPLALLPPNNQLYEPGKKSPIGIVYSYGAGASIKSKDEDVYDMSKYGKHFNNIKFNIIKKFF